MRTHVPRQLGLVLALRGALFLCAVVGWYAGMTFNGRFTLGDQAYFSQTSTLIAGLVAAAGLVFAMRGATPGWLRAVRGASTSFCLVVLIIFALLLGGDYSTLSSAMMHLVVPTLALADWLVVTPVRRLRVWWALAWTAFPLAYLPIYVWASLSRPESLYPFFDPRRADFGQWFIILLIVFLVVQFAVWGLGRQCARVTERRAAAVQGNGQNHLHSPTPRDRLGRNEP